MTDWFERGRELMRQDGLSQTGVDPDAFDAVYSYLVDFGLIDYDVEKELFYNLDADLSEEDDG